MSASLLNAATLPAGAAQPGASVGIGAQAAQAAQVKGPMAAFDALLAAFFGDQGLIGSAVAGQIVVGQPGVAGPTAGKTATKSPGAKDAATGATGSEKAASATASAADAAATATDAALTLAAPILPNATTATPTQPAAAAGTGQAPDTGLSGKPAAALAQLTAATAAVDAKTAKAAGLVAQDTTKTVTPATGEATATPAAGKPNLPGSAQPAQPLQAPGLSNQTPATTAAALPTPTPVAIPVAAAQGKTAETANGGKDKTDTGKLVRVDGARTEAANTAIAGKVVVAAQASADGAGKDASSQQREPADPATADAKPAAGDTAQQASDFNVATNSTAGANAAAMAHAAALVRGSPQTVANLAAQIAKKLDGRTSRFDVQLDPAGLGKVDVRVEIDAAGKMTAAMNFDSQQAANELKSRAGDLQRALEQAGFDMSGGMSFDVTGQGQGRAQGQDTDNSPTFRGRAFQAVLDGATEADAGQIASYSRASPAGVDIRI